MTADFSASVRYQDFIPAPSICGDSGLFLPFREWIIAMLDERFARLRTHRNNIARYRGLLKTNLTDLERQFIERRLSEEQSEFELLSQAPSPSHLRFRTILQRDRHLTGPNKAFGPIGTVWLERVNYRPPVPAPKSAPGETVMNWRPQFSMAGAVSFLEAGL